MDESPEHYHLSVTLVMNLLVKIVLASVSLCALLYNGLSLGVLASFLAWDSSDPGLQKHQTEDLHSWIGGSMWFWDVH